MVATGRISFAFATNLAGIYTHESGVLRDVGLPIVGLHVFYGVSFIV